MINQQYNKVSFFFGTAISQFVFFWRKTTVKLNISYIGRNDFAKKGNDQKNFTRDLSEKSEIAASEIVYNTTINCHRQYLKLFSHCQKSFKPATMLNTWKCAPCVSDGDDASLHCTLKNSFQILFMKFCIPHWLR